MKTKIYLIALVSALLYWINYSLVSGTATDGSYYGHGDMMGSWNGSSFGMLMIGMMTFWFIIDLLLAYVVYKDAISNNSPNALVWAIIVFFTSLLGILLYVLLRSPQNHYSTNPPSSYSATTSQPQAQIHSFCPSCGTQLDSSSKFCSTCGAVVK